MQLLQLYTSMLAAGHMTADADGVIYREIRGMEEKTPVVVKQLNGDKAYMVMPIKKQTDKTDWSDRVVFHPLRENTQRGESIVMESFRNNMTDRINAAVLTLMVSVLALAADTSRQVGLNSDQLGYLALLPDADKKAVEIFNDLIVKTATSHKPVRMFIKHSGVKDGVIYRRLSNVHSPLREELINAGDRKIKGVSLRVKDMATFQALFTIVLPLGKGNDFGAYTQGSNSVRAPSIDAFMRSIRMIAEGINDLARIFDSAVPGLEDSIVFDMNWVETFEDIDAYGPKILMIPAMPGNEGRVLNERADSVSAEVPPWEPADAPPSGMAKTERTERTATASTPRNPAYGARESVITTPRSSPAEEKAIKGSVFQQMLDRERDGDRDSDYRDRSGRRPHDPGVANGYEPLTSYGGRYDDRRDNRRDDRRDSRRDTRRY